MSTESPKSTSSPEKHPELSQTLLSAREALGLSVTQLSKQTKIPPQVITQLENSNPANLPAAPYIRGFLRTLAQTLELRPELLLELYQVNDKKETHQSPPENVLSAPSPKQPKIIVIFILGVLVVLFFVLIKQRSGNELSKTPNFSSNIADPLPEIEAFKSPYPDSSDADTDSSALYLKDSVDSYPENPIPKPSTTVSSLSNDESMKSTHESTFQCLKDSVWIGITRKGRKITQKIMTEGESWKITYKDSTRVRIGVLNGVSVQLGKGVFFPLSKSFVIFNDTLINKTR